MADIKIDGTDSTKINLDVDDSNDLVLNLTVIECRVLVACV